MMTSVPQFNTASSSSSYENPRRQRRQATACTSCRDRRVRCDRARPICLRCSKRHQLCEYITPPPSGIEFVTERPRPSDLAVPSETWKSVFESQTALVDSANPKTDAGKAQAVPLWALAEGGVFKQTSQDESVPPASLDPIVPISSLGEPFLSTLFSGLAPRETYLPYFENFLLTIHPLLPFYPIAVIRQTYVEFWDNLSLNTSTELLVLILAILYTGAANVVASQGTQDSAIIRGMYDKLMVALDLSTYHVVSSESCLRLLHGVVIFNTFRASQLSPFIAFGFLPFAIRFAQSLRLHIHQEAETFIESEPRRRLWWHMVFMDVESTVASGLQGIIRLDGQTIKLPTIDNNSTLRAEFPHTAVAIAMQGHWEMANRMHAWLERKPEQHEIVHFGRIIEHLLDLIPNSEGSEWARLYLRMLVDRVYCMLGLRFWQLDQFKGTNCHSEVLRTARSFLKKYLRLSELSGELGFSWFLPGLIQPIHALMIILMHLSGCEHPDEETGLSRDLVDQVISLRMIRIYNSSTHLAAGTNIHTIPQYNPRYRAMNTLRRRVWEKFNWLIVVKSNSQDSDSERRRSNDASGSQADFTTNLPYGDQAIWDDWDPFANGIPSEPINWDDWASLMPDFFTDGSY